VSDRQQAHDGAQERSLPRAVRARDAIALVQAAQHVAEVSFRVLFEARQHLVEQQQPRVGGERRGARATSSAFNSVKASSLSALRSAFAVRPTTARMSSMPLRSALPAPKRRATIRFSRTLKLCSGGGI